MKELELIKEESEDIKIMPAAGKIAGKYPDDFMKNGGENEQ